MSISKERREELRDYADSGESACPTKTEVHTLVDMADERDKYRALLEEASGFVRCKDTADRIDAALEGKTND